MLLGAHIGIAEGLALAPVTGRKIGADAIQIFSKSPQMWAGAPLSDEAIAGFRAAVAAERIAATAIHHGYLANLASPKKAGLARSRHAFVEELDRAERIGVDALIVHPGADLGQGRTEALKRLTESLNEAFAQRPGYRVRTLLENMAGQGTTLGAEFSELASVLHGLDEPARAGVALDTCHMFAAGHDFRSDSAYGTLVDRLASELGTDRVRAFHFNDAKGELGSHLDRHENIGRGGIGVEGFYHFVNDPRWERCPAYLETPLGEDGYSAYERDLATLQGLRAPARRASARTA